MNAKQRANDSQQVEATVSAHLSDRTSTASRRYRCDACANCPGIRLGDRYRRSVKVQDGRFSVYRTCQGFFVEMGATDLLEAAKWTYKGRQENPL